jgi:competence/damage-inducible protein CinA-like protein
MRLELILTGAELLDGRRADTHAQRLGSALRSLGLSISRATVVGDGEEEIAAALRAAMERADVVICTGGLGPTIDDRTRDAAAEVFGLPLVEDPETLNWILELFATFRREMPPNNARQALFPQGATILPNPIGTARGFSVDRDDRLIIFTPGPPRELAMMIEQEILPLLDKRLPDRDALATVSLRTFGYGEGGLDKALRGVEFGEVDLAFTATTPEVILTLTVNDAVAEAAEAKLNSAKRAIENVVGDAIISDDGRTLEEVVFGLLQAAKMTIATAESCTGGMIAARLTSVPGVSDYFLQGAVTYSNEAKVQRLGVAAELIDQHGAVSAEVARAMAEGIRKTAGTDYGLGITGIAGPGGGTPEKPIGTVFTALAGPDGTRDWRDRLPGGRERVRLLATESALNRLRKELKQ